MIVRISLVVWSLLLASTSVHAEIFKCRQGQRVVYQEIPCPAGTHSLTPPQAPPPPSAFAVEQARARARNDIAEAAALRKHEERTVKAREKQQAVARKQETECARLLSRIETAEARTELSKSQKNTLKSDQRQYRKECAPL